MYSYIFNDKEYFDDDGRCIVVVHTRAATRGTHRCLMPGWFDILFVCRKIHREAGCLPLSQHLRFNDFFALEKLCAALSPAQRRAIKSVNVPIDGAFEFVHRNQKLVLKTKAKRVSDYLPGPLQIQLRMRHYWSFSISSATYSEFVAREGNMIEEWLLDGGGEKFKVSWV